MKGYDPSRAQQDLRRSIRSRPTTPDHAVVLIDDQPQGMLSTLFEPEQTRRLLLAPQPAQPNCPGVPAVLTTTMADGINAPLVWALCAAFAGQDVSDRTVIDVWPDLCVDEGRRSDVTQQGHHRGYLVHAVASARVLRRT